jgi:hypothetical protein
VKALVAEMVGNFTKRLGEAYGLQVRELTGEGRGLCGSVAALCAVPARNRSCAAWVPMVWSRWLGRTGGNGGECNKWTAGLTVGC